MYPLSHKIIISQPCLPLLLGLSTDSGSDYFEPGIRTSYLERDALAVTSPAALVPKSADSQS